MITCTLIPGRHLYARFITAWANTSILDHCRCVATIIKNFRDCFGVVKEIPLFLSLVTYLATLQATLVGWLTEKLGVRLGCDTVVFKISLVKLCHLVETIVLYEVLDVGLKDLVETKDFLVYFHEVFFVFKTPHILDYFKQLGIFFLPRVIHNWHAVLQVSCEGEETVVHKKHFGEIQSSEQLQIFHK